MTTIYIDVYIDNKFYHKFSYPNKFKLKDLLSKIGTDAKYTRLYLL